MCQFDNQISIFLAACFLSPSKQQNGVEQCLCCVDACELKALHQIHVECACVAACVRV